MTVVHHPPRLPASKLAHRPTRPSVLPRCHQMKLPLSECYRQPATSQTFFSRTENMLYFFFLRDGLQWRAGKARGMNSLISSDLVLCLTLVLLFRALFSNTLSSLLLILFLLRVCPHFDPPFWFPDKCSRIKCHSSHGMTVLKENRCPSQPQRALAPSWCPSTCRENGVLLFFLLPSSHSFISFPPFLSSSPHRSPAVSHQLPSVSLQVYLPSLPIAPI